MKIFKKKHPQPPAAPPALEQIRSTIRDLRRVTIIAAAVLIVIGLFFIFLPKYSARFICYAAGAGFCVWGIVRFIIYLRSERQMTFGAYSAIKGCALIAFGIYVFIRPDFFADILTTILGILMLLDALMKLQHSLDLQRIRNKLWWVLLAAAAVTLVLGILILVNPFETAIVLTIFTGISLVLDGIFDIVSVIYISTCAKQVHDYVTGATKVVAEEDAKVVSSTPAPAPAPASVPTPEPAPESYSTPDASADAPAPNATGTSDSPESSAPPQ